MAEKNTGKGIGYMRPFAKRAKWRAQHQKNRQIRAELYSSMKGEVNGGKALEWHSRLKALSSGTA